MDVSGTQKTIVKPQSVVGTDAFWSQYKMFIITIGTKVHNIIMDSWNSWILSLDTEKSCNRVSQGSSRDVAAQCIGCCSKYYCQCRDETRHDGRSERIVIAKKVSNNERQTGTEQERADHKRKEKLLQILLDIMYFCPRLTDQAMSSRLNLQSPISQPSISKDAGSVPQHLHHKPKSIISCK